jgi:hypothetical protein
VCDSGYADCDGNPVNGCETSTDTDASNCGACGKACKVGGCSLGVCEISFLYTPSNFDPDAASLNPGATSALTLFDCGTTTFDSGTLQWGGTCPGFVAPVPVTITQSDGSSAVVLPFQDITVASGSTLKFVGDKPVILAVYGDATISGTVSASAVGTTPGAGGNVSCGASQGGDGSGSTARNYGASGGGGGGFITAGGDGGNANTDKCCGGSNTVQPGGVGGIARTTSASDPLLAGCAGGRAGGCTTDGGAGGGAVQISTSGALTVTGAVRANGGDGALPCGANDEGGGTGGGSGGGILLESTALTTTGATITANGGAGGPDGGYFHCSNGTAGSTSPTSPGGNGKNCVGGSPGGGGGYGRIQLLDR